MTDIQPTLLRTTGKYTNLLIENGIRTMRDRYAYFPRTYEDRSQVVSLSDIFFQSLDKTAVIAHAQCIEKTVVIRQKKYRQLTFRDHDGKEAFALFNYRQSYLIQHVKKDGRYLIIGRTAIKAGQLTFRYPEIIDSDETYDESKVQSHQIGRIYPIYPELQGIKPSRFATKMRQTLDYVGEYIHEHLPDDVRLRYELPDVVTATRQMHYPDSREDFRQAQRRVMWDRLLRMQLYSQLYRQSYQQTWVEESDDDLDVFRVMQRKQAPEQEALLTVELSPRSQQASTTPLAQGGQDE
ncbi:MAG: hypothetical protein H6766_04735 [Candidatus Peribacteria bacterium]|nr:MAG: hypothetical protein H6766_04735 [Candidatus Peribacteria bacterium]